jgi:hypothetical protein
VCLLPAALAAQVQPRADQQTGRALWPTQSISSSSRRGCNSLMGGYLGYHSAGKPLASASPRKRLTRTKPARRKASPSSPAWHLLCPRARNWPWRVARDSPSAWTSRGMLASRRARRSWSGVSLSLASFASAAARSSRRAYALTRWACDRACGVGCWPAPARSKTRLARPRRELQRRDHPRCEAARAPLLKRRRLPHVH